MLICGLLALEREELELLRTPRLSGIASPPKARRVRRKSARAREAERAQEEQTTKVARIFPYRRSDRHLGTSHLSTERIDLREIFGSLLTLLVGPKYASHPLRKCACCSVKK